VCTYSYFPVYPVASARHFFSVTAQPRVLLCEHDPIMAWLLVEVLRDEGIEVTSCASLEEVNVALRQHPDAVVVSDPWSRSAQPDLSADERHIIVELAARARLILTTTRQWALQSERLLLDGVTVLAKPLDLEELLHAVRLSCALRS
jgi:DNA-binding NtrC family response regulator